METLSTPSDIKVGKISEYTIDSEKAHAFGPTPVPVPGPILLSCTTQFRNTVVASKTNMVSTKITLTAHTDSKYNPITLFETATTFKSVDAAVKALAAEWNITVPSLTLAYALFSKVVFLEIERDAIFFVASNGTHRLYLKSPEGTHVWYTDAKAVYCRKSKLFALDGDGYSMFVDFGI